jgi:pimeloyl-ACP methyl ester carboxylesterase
MPTTVAPRLQTRVVPFTAGDGLPLNLINIRTEQEPVRGPVLLIHGAGVRANIFRPPIARTIVDELVEAGYDVWLENWRASIDVPANCWTLDQAAVYDHPAAVKRIVAETGRDRMKAIVHCQGSTSFFLAAMSGLTPEVTTIVSNAVSMHPVLASLAVLKLRCVGAFGYASDYMNPQWGLRADTLPAKFIDLIVRLTHHECDNAVCKHVSFTYGAGFPSLWRHENLTSDTHAWIQHEFAACPVVFFRQMARSIRAGRIVPMEARSELPHDLFVAAPRTDARIVLITGALNQSFLPESQVRSFRYLESMRPNYHSLHVIPNYSHLDIFLGRNAATDVFPIVMGELNREH